MLMRKEEACRYSRFIRHKNPRRTKMGNCCVMSQRGFVQTDITRPSPHKKKGSAVSSLICLKDFVKWDAALCDLFTQKALHAKDNMCNMSITLSVKSGAYSKCQSAQSLCFVSFCLSLSLVLV